MGVKERGKGLHSKFSLFHISLYFAVDFSSPITCVIFLAQTGTVVNKCL